MRAMPIRYEKFEKKMLDVMIQKEYKPDIDDRLRQAFLVSAFMSDHPWADSAVPGN